MKAKDLAEELLKHPDYDVELVYSTFIRDGILDKAEKEIRNDG